ncbi:MAG TPA: MFS transporter [Pseudomonadales bacterium]|nr:MFS transporter [Pseudomonadales bacterium]
MFEKWRQTLVHFRDPRLWWVFLLGCSSGFPWVVIGSNLNGWLKDAGVGRADIGLLGSVFTMYAINFMWAPLLDRVKLPVFRRLGQRRGWILFCQMAMLLCLVAMTSLKPSEQLFLTGALALMVAIFSATQDIAIDAFRIDHFNNNERDLYPLAAAMGIVGWWTGYSWPGALSFNMADTIGWHNVVWLMVGVNLLLMVFTLIVREPTVDREALQARAAKDYGAVGGFTRWLLITIIEPFRDFFRRNGVQVALTLMAFIFLFKIGEAFLGRMSIVFYKEVGFSNEQIGNYSKMFGWFVTVAFTLLGSVINARFGVIKGLMIGGLAMAASNLMFAWIAVVGPEVWLLLLTLVVDNFTTAFSTVAFVAFLTALTGRAFSATQYAMLASLGNLSRTTLASSSGYLVDWLGSWERFFIVTTLMVIPSLVMLWLLREKLEKASNQ